MMQIQGHTVLPKNNYKVNGITYVFDEHQEDDPLTDWVSIFLDHTLYDTVYFQLTHTKRSSLVFTNCSNVYLNEMELILKSKRASLKLIR